MTYATKTILVDGGGNPIPQIWDGTNFVPYEGKVTVEGVADVQLTGSKAEYSWDSGDVPPVPVASATGIIVGVVVDTKTLCVWNPTTSAWVEWMVL